MFSCSISLCMHDYEHILSVSIIPQFIHCLYTYFLLCSLQHFPFCSFLTFIRYIPSYSFLNLHSSSFFHLHLYPSLSFVRLVSCTFLSFCVLPLSNFVFLPFPFFLTEFISIYVSFSFSLSQKQYCEGLSGADSRS